MSAYRAPASAGSGVWRPLQSQPQIGGDTALLLTDGTVIMHAFCSGAWFRLTPDRKGSYVKGTWTEVAAMQDGYAPVYFASQVLADGRLIVNGGEYNCQNGNCDDVETVQGSLYDPVKNVWTPVSPPSGWSTIGDAQSVVRADNVYMLANCCSSDSAVAAISGSNVTWTVLPAAQTHKADLNNEEGWTLLPNKTVLTIDTIRGADQPNSSTEIFSAPNGLWTNGRRTVGQVVSGREIGPAPLMPNGFVFQAGASGHNSVMNATTGKWYAAPDFPQIDGHLVSADGPAAVLTDGNVLIEASPDTGNPPSHFFEIRWIRRQKIATITQVDDPDFADQVLPYYSRMLELPTGQIFWTAPTELEVYTPKGRIPDAWRPTITAAPATVTPGGSNYVVQGTLFNGLTQGAYFGDDAQMAINYPLARITQTGTHDVCYARTHDHATMGIYDGRLTSTMFDVPSGCEKGASSLEIIANGIASKAIALTVE